MAQNQEFLAALDTFMTKENGGASVCKNTPSAKLEKGRKTEHSAKYIKNANETLENLSQEYQVPSHVIQALFKKITPQQVKACAKTSPEGSEYTRGGSVTPVPSGSVTPRHEGGSFHAHTPPVVIPDNETEDEGDEKNTDQLHAGNSESVTGCTSDPNQLNFKEDLGDKPEDSTKNNAAESNGSDCREHTPLKGQLDGVNAESLRLLQNMQEVVESNNQALCALLENSQVEMQTQFLKRCAVALEALVDSQDKRKKRKVPSE